MPDVAVVARSESAGALLVLGTIPVGVAGLLLEHAFRTVLSKPVPTAAFLLLNGLVLLAAEQMRRRADNGGATSTAGARHAQRPTREGIDRGPDELAAVEDSGGDVDERVSGPASDARLAAQPIGRAVLIAAAQIAALAPGISRSGITMAAGLWAGLSHEDAARFSFLIATPVIAAAGLLKLGDLAGPLGDGIHGQILLGSALSGLGAYLSVRFLTRYFATRSLRPFGWYCVAAGAACLIWFAVR